MAVACTWSGAAVESDPVPVVIALDDYVALFRMSPDSAMFADSDGNLGQFTYELWENTGVYADLVNDTAGVNSTELRITRREYGGEYCVDLNEVMVLWLTVLQLPDEAAVRSCIDHFCSGDLELTREVDRYEGDLPAMVGSSGEIYRAIWGVDNQTVAWVSYKPCERGRSTAAADMMAFETWVVVKGWGND